jgi:hypothetical protein
VRQLKAENYTSRVMHMCLVARLHVFFYSIPGAQLCAPGALPEAPATAATLHYVYLF